MKNTSHQHKQRFTHTCGRKEPTMYDSGWIGSLLGKVPTWAIILQFVGVVVAFIGTTLALIVG